MIEETLNIKVSDKVGEKQPEAKKFYYTPSAISVWDPVIFNTSLEIDSVIIYASNAPGEFNFINLNSKQFA